jgi:type I restriction enzyme S subunit
LTIEGLKNSSATILQPNTILMTSRAGIGDLGILKIQAATNQGFQSLIAKQNISYEFLYYLILSKKQLVKKVIFTVNIYS